MRALLRLALVVGARPNLVKAAPLVRAFGARRGLRATLIHTGQHYDDAMSGVFLRHLEIKEPERHLRVGSGSHAVQTARIMTRIEQVFRAERFDRVMVVGDVNSTLAASLVAVKLGMPVDHVEAGLRSGDRSMPEEINRIATDAIAARFFASEPAGVRNLLREGHDRATVHLVGNVMIDSLRRVLPRARARAAWADYGLAPGGYAVATLHRPANVDARDRLLGLIEALQKIAASTPVLFPVHPRTRKRLPRGLRLPGVRLLDPLGYLEFLSLLSRCRLVVTDSGGIQEEATALRVPCLTMRDTTERPITVSLGTNTLVGSDYGLLQRKVDAILGGRYKKGALPPLWDGRAAERIAAIVARER